MSTVLDPVVVEDPSEDIWADHDEKGSEDVSRGVALLDEYYPGWRDEIDLGKLNMSSSDNCILGQLYGSYADGIYVLWDGYGLHHGSACAGGYGFCGPWTKKHWVKAVTG